MDNGALHFFSPQLSLFRKSEEFYTFSAFRAYVASYLALIRPCIALDWIDEIGEEKEKIDRN